MNVSNIGFHAGELYRDAEAPAQGKSEAPAVGDPKVRKLEMVEKAMKDAQVSKNVNLMMICSLLIEFGQLLKSTSALISLEELQNYVQSLKVAAGEVRKRAATELIGKSLGAGLGIGGAVVTCAGVGVSARYAATKQEGVSEQLQLVERNSIRDMYSSLGQATSSSGGIVESGLGISSSEHLSAEKQYEAEGQQFNYSSQMLRDQRQDMHQMMGTILGIVQEIQQIKAQANQYIVRQ